jgi:hypothetical protein
VYVSQPISVHHLLFECPVLIKLYSEYHLNLKKLDMHSIFDSAIIVDVVKVIYNSSVNSFYDSLFFMRVYVCEVACASHHF